MPLPKNLPNNPNFYVDNMPTEQDAHVQPGSNPMLSSALSSLANGVAAGAQSPVPTPGPKRNPDQLYERRTDANGHSLLVPVPTPASSLAMGSLKSGVAAGATPPSPGSMPAPTLNPGLSLAQGMGDYTPDQLSSAISSMNAMPTPQAPAPSPSGGPYTGGYEFMSRPTAGGVYGVSQMMGNDADRMKLQGAIQKEVAAQEGYDRMLASMNNAAVQREGIQADLMGKKETNMAADRRQQEGMLHAEKLQGMQGKTQKEIAQMQNDLADKKIAESDKKEDRRIEETAQRDAVNQAARIRAETLRDPSKKPADAERVAGMYLQSIGRGPDGSKIAAAGKDGQAPPPADKGTVDFKMQNQVASDIEQSKTKPGETVVEKLLPFLDSSHYKDAAARQELIKQLRSQPNSSKVKHDIFSKLGETLWRIGGNDGAKVGGWSLEPGTYAGDNKRWLVGPDGVRFQVEPSNWIYPGFNKEKHVKDAERLAPFAMDLIKDSE
jgi:hypothetical protein